MKRHDPGRYSCVRQPTAETAAAAAVQRTSLAPRVVNNRYFAEGQPRRLPPGCLVSELWSKNRVLTLTKLKKMFFLLLETASLSTAEYSRAARVELEYK